MKDLHLDYLTAIAENSAGLATAAEANLTAAVEHCPNWTVADLVAHVTEVQWFWGTIAEERLQEPPDSGRRPPRLPDDQLIGAFREGAERLVATLAAADPAEPVWTWAPTQHDIAFIVRHQVQEAAVHRFDAENAVAGRATPGCHLATDLAVDAVSEFLTFSVSSEADPAEPARPALAGQLTLRCSDADAGWWVKDGSAPGTLAFDTTGASGPAVTASAWHLLLWLYGRVDLQSDHVPGDMLERFLALRFTD